MKIAGKIFIAVVGFTGVGLMSMGTFAASGIHFSMHHKSHHAATDFGSGKVVKFLPFSFEKTTTQLDLNEIDKKVIKGEKKGKEDNDENDFDNLEFHGGALGFLWNFLDDTQLTQNQKVEIQLLQANKQKKMAELLEKMNSSNDEEKIDISNAMKQVNNEFLENLKQYIPEEKAEEYNDFLNELPDRDRKAEKKKGVKIS